MGRRNLVIVFINFFLIFIIRNQCISSELKSFDGAVTQFKSSYSCPSPRISPPSFDGDGRLFGCIDGVAQTAKYFINEDGPSGRVKNVKIMWNDWYKDIGYGRHPDAKEAELMLIGMLKSYAPAGAESALRAFRSDKPWSLIVDSVKLNYKYTRGPAIDERLLTVLPAD